MKMKWKKVSSNGVCANLPYKVKTQYLQILNMIHTSIKHPVSGQSTSMVKECMNIMFDRVDTAFSYWRAVIVC